MKKVVFSLICVLMAALLGPACASAEDVNLPNGDAYLIANTQATLTIPSTLSLTNVGWTIADTTVLERVSTTNSSCTVLPKKVGFTTVTAVGNSGSSQVTVGPTTVPVIASATAQTNLALSGGGTSLNVGNQGAISIPSSLSLTGVNWRSSDESILKLVTQANTGCTVQALAAGAASIFAIGYNASGDPVVVGPTEFTVTTAGVTDLVLTGTSNLVVGTQAVISIPSTLSLHGVTWAMDASYLQGVSSSDLNCTVLPLQAGSTVVRATGYDIYGAATTVGPTAFTIFPSSQEADLTLGTGKTYLVAGDQTTVSLNTSLSNATWWSSDSSILSVLSGATSTGCTVYPVKAGTATLYVSGTDASGVQTNLSRKFYILDTSNVITIAVDALDALSLTAGASRDVDLSSKVHATFTLNGVAESADIAYGISSSSSNTSVVKSSVPTSGVLTFRLEAQSGGSAVVTVSPTVTGLTGSGNEYVTLQSSTMNVTVTNAGGGPTSGSGSGGGCSAGWLGLTAAMGLPLLTRRRR